MFSTDYNRKIAEQVNKINQDFIKHSKRVNRSGGGLLNVAEVDKTALGRPIGGAKMEGEGFFGDIWSGIKHVFGGAIPDELLEDVGGVKPKKKKDVKKKMNVEEVLSNVDSVLSNVDSVLGGKKKKGKKGKGIYEEDDLMEDEPVEENEEKEGGRKKYVKKALKKGKKGKKGGNILDDLVDTVGKVAPLLPLVALGKPKKGKGVSGAGAKKSSSWIEHVKKYAKKHNMKYSEALKSARATYKK